MAEAGNYVLRVSRLRHRIRVSDVKVLHARTVSEGPVHVVVHEFLLQLLSLTSLYLFGGVFISALADQRLVNQLTDGLLVNVLGFDFLA